METRVFTEEELDILLAVCEKYIVIRNGYNTETIRLYPDSLRMHEYYDFTIHNEDKLVVSKVYEGEFDKSQENKYFNRNGINDALTYFNLV